MKANGPDEKNEAARSSFKYLNIFNKFYSFEKTTLSIGYQICKSTSWNKATVGDKVMKELGKKKESLDIDSYAYAYLNSKLKCLLVHWVVSLLDITDPNWWAWNTPSIKLLLSQRRYYSFDERFFDNAIYPDIYWRNERG